ncbi:hypothetical protein GCM10010517_31820 [Streptosporangium fragile]|uniref:DUF4349 domain-containing protein n=1 Tax=Streptosporangium fragile TaxID=46186 RepID=A0ABN3VXJ4_9ACTN
MNRFRYGLRLAAPLVGLALTVCACGGGSSGESASYSGGAPPPAADAQAPPKAVPAGPGAAESGGSETDQARTGQVQVQVVPENRSIIYTAEMTVRAKDVDAAADRARQIVTAAGGYLASERSDAFSGGEGSATLVFKIPPGNYPGAVERLGKDLGTRESLQQNTEDVTEEVADVESRLKSARAALDSLRTLLKKANTIGEVLEVEREISNRESELESLQARQKSLASRTSMATLTLNLVGPAAVVPEEDDGPSGLLGGLRAGWESLVTFLEAGLVVLGVLLPWLIVIVPLWLLVTVLLRRRRRRNAPGSRIRADRLSSDRLPEDEPSEDGSPASEPSAPAPSQD